MTKVELTIHLYPSEFGPTHMADESTLSSTCESNTKAVGIALVGSLNFLKFPSRFFDLGNQFRDVAGCLHRINYKLLFLQQEFIIILDMFPVKF